jgi:hypothetical protein
MILNCSLHVIALRLSVRITKPIRERAGFAIISFIGLSRLCCTHTEGVCCRILTVLVSEVVIRLTYRLSPLRQSKLLAGRTFTPSQLVASHLQGWGSRLKLTTGSHCAPSHIRTGTQRFHNRHASLDPVCTWPRGHMFIYQSCQKTGSNVVWPSKPKPKTGIAGWQNLIEFIFYKVLAEPIDVLEICFRSQKGRQR